MGVKDEEQGLATDKEETKELGTEQVKPREAGMRYQLVESGRYGTL